MLEIKLRQHIFSEKKFNMDFSLKPGEMVALLGSNGAGKTTLIKQICGIIPARGRIMLGDERIDGERINYKNSWRIALGSCEHTFLEDFTIEEQRDFYKMNFPAFKEKRFDLLIDYFKLPLKRKIKKMSAGEKNQVETVFALCQGADYIFLDEPFANNDIFHREDFYKLLLGILEDHECLVIATHLVEEINNVVSRTILLKNFNMIGDKTTEQLQDEGLDIVTWMKDKFGYNEKKAYETITQLEEEKNA